MIVASLFHDFLGQNFGLPGGGLYSNLIASALLGTGAFIYGRAFEKRSVERHEDMKAHITEHMERLHDHINQSKSKEKKWPTHR